MATAVRDTVRDSDGFEWERQKDDDAHRGQFCVLDASGDTRVMWDRRSPDEVAAARTQFETLVGKKGYSAFVATGEEGARGRRLTTFDPEVERMILVPAYQGG